MAQKIKKGDMVYVISGDEKGSKAKVVKVIPEKNHVILEGINLKKKHVRPSAQNPEGGIIQKESSIDLSNVAHINTSEEETLNWSSRLVTRVGFRFNEAGKKVRYAKKTNQDIQEVSKS